MPAVAMTREMGSRGREVAQRVADDLGLTLVLHELIEHDLAERLQVPASAVHHRFEGGATLRERWQIPSRRLAEYTAEEILELAQKGNVLIPAGAHVGLFATCPMWCACASAPPWSCASET
jgi:Cytidylate kinase-like family